MVDSLNSQDDRLDYLDYYSTSVVLARLGMLLHVESNKRPNNKVSQYNSITSTLRRVSELRKYGKSAVLKFDYRKICLWAPRVAKRPAPSAASRGCRRAASRRGLHRPSVLFPGCKPCNPDFHSAKVMA
ncbi:hypothetical protein EVAR_23564_1 [Eumeta japonica]|uniref:Uncharacterized protein n=1 Tax=Eumeta variegata TaxID=151549 RepID=A0A4C1WXX6_EUMVA|nr:hypothetical protein EVAR_23564_1 [Eumeta japonica]